MRPHTPNSGQKEGLLEWINLLPQVIIWVSHGPSWFHSCPVNFLANSMIRTEQVSQVIALYMTRNGTMWLGIADGSDCARRQCGQGLGKNILVRNHDKIFTAIKAMVRSQGLRSRKKVASGRIWTRDIQINSNICAREPHYTSTNTYAHSYSLCFIGSPGRSLTVSKTAWVLVVESLS